MLFRSLGDEEALLCREVSLQQPVYWRLVETGEKLLLKIRYATPAQEVEIQEVSSDLIRVRAALPFKAVTPGQFGVFYQRDSIVAAGEIV